MPAVCGCATSAVRDATHYPLSLVAVPGEQLRLRLDYRSDLFDRESVEALAERLVRLLEAAVADPDRAIGRLDILAPAERRTILREWNDTARAIAAATLPELFAAQVARRRMRSRWCSKQTASATASSMRAEPAGASPARARRRARGGGGAVRGALARDDRRAARHPQGRRRLSAARPDYPHERLAFMLADAGAPVLVTQSGLRARLPGHGARLVCLDADGPAIARHPTSAPASGLDPQNLAYVIYTSGSTGTPKGVVVAHAGSPILRPSDRSTSPIDARCPRPAVGVAELRCFGLGNFRRAAQRRLLRPLCDDRDQPSAAALCARMAHVTRSGVTHCDVAAGGRWPTARGPAAADVDRRRRGVSPAVWPRGRRGGGYDQRLWPDRDDGVRNHERARSDAHDSVRSAVRSGTRGFTCWTGVWSL